MKELIHTGNISGITAAASSQHGTVTVLWEGEVFEVTTFRTDGDYADHRHPDGVKFASHIDGSRFFLGPKESMAIQRALGSDIVMAFDECTPYPCIYEDAEKSLKQTLRWELMSREQPLDPHQFRFGIVQGSVYHDLRKHSAEKLVKMDFDGYSIGGLSVGEPEEIMFECVERVTPYLPEDKPRYLMGVGTPKQIYENVRRGIDMFDCVMPTRLARHGSAFIKGGITLPVKAG